MCSKNKKSQKPLWAFACSENLSGDDDRAALRTGRVMCVFATLSSGQRGRIAVRWKGKRVNEVEAVWMPQWQNGREREKRKETENKEGRERGGQHRVSLSIFAAGEEKAKNTPPAFFPPREGVRREERARDRKAKKKKRAFPSSVPPPSPASGCPVLPFPRFFFFFSHRRNQSRQLCYPCGLLHIVWLGWGIEFLPVVRTVGENTWERATRHQNSDEVLLNEVEAAPRDKVWKRNILIVIFRNLALCPSSVHSHISWRIPKELSADFPRRIRPNCIPTEALWSERHRFIVSDHTCASNITAVDSSLLCFCCKLFSFTPPPLSLQAPGPLRRSCGGGWRTALRSSGILFAARWRNWPTLRPARGRSTPTRSSRTWDTRRGGYNVGCLLNMREIRRVETIKSTAKLTQKSVENRMTTADC